MKFSDFIEKLKNRKFVRITKIITGSATFALLLSIVFFAVESYSNMKESQELTDKLKEQSDNLMKIQSSLSTRYLGEFPNFLPNISELYSHVKVGDTIIIMEDVLFYGINSDPAQFYNSNLQLMDLANKGVHVMVFYYRPRSMTFDMTINEWALSPACYKEYKETLMEFHRRSALYKAKKRRIIDSCANLHCSKQATDQLIFALMEKTFGDIIDKNFLVEQKNRMLRQNPDADNSADSTLAAARDDNEQIRNILPEKYFAKTRTTDNSYFIKFITTRRRPTMSSVNATATTRTEKEVRAMCEKMDEIRTKYLGKEGEPMDGITYANVRDMFTEMTGVMEETYKKNPTVTMVPVDEFLSVFSWCVQSKSTGDKAIMAFPSRYSSSEIGFFTTDNTMTNYVFTMKQGILTNYRPKE